LRVDEIIAQLQALIAANVETRPVPYVHGFAMRETISSINVEATADDGKKCPDIL